MGYLGKRIATAGLVGALVLTVATIGGTAVAAQGTPLEGGLRPGVKVYLAEMPGDFNSYLKAAFAKKKVPVALVDSRDQAEFEIKATSESQKASAAKKIFMGSWHSDEQASISVASLRSGDIVFAYSANKKNSARGKQTSAEACAKHFKEAIDKKK
jgi:hypothetical protein